MTYNIIPYIASVNSAGTDMHDSATTMFMRCKMNGINGICKVHTMYMPTACVADPGAQNIALKLSPRAQTDVRQPQINRCTTDKYGARSGSPQLIQVSVSMLNQVGNRCHSLFHPLSFVSPPG